MKKRWHRHWPLLAVVILAILLRIPLLNGSFWMDEAAQALESARPWSEQLQIRDDFQPPLLHLIVALAIQVNDNEWWLRTWGALIPGILTIMGSYVVALEVGKWVFGHNPPKSQNKNVSRQNHVVIPNIKLVMLSRHSRDQHLKTYLRSLDQSILLASLTSLLLATSSIHIFYSQELRQYSLPAMWGIWSWWVLIKMSAITIGSRKWWRWGSGWVILSILGLYSSYLYPFLLISQLVWIALTLFRHAELVLIDRHAGHQPRHTRHQPRHAVPTQSGSASSKHGKHSTNLSYRPIIQSTTSCPATSNQIIDTICPWVHWLTLGLLILLAFLPWLPSFLDQLSAGQMLRLSLPGWETVVSTPQLKAIALVGGKFLFGVSDITPNPDLAIRTLTFMGLIVICGYCLWRIMTRHPEPNTDDRHSEPNHINYRAELACPESSGDPASSNLNTENPNGMLKQVQHNEALISRKGLSKTLFLILIAFCVPLLTAWLVSFIVPVLQPKRVLYLLPFWYLGLSLLITTVLVSYQTWPFKIWPVLLLGLLLIFNLGSTTAYWLDPTLQRENWRQAWLDINQSYGDNTPKLFLFDGPFASWAWYDRQLSKSSTANDFSFEGVRTADQTQATLIIELASHQYTQPVIIYFDYLSDLTDPSRLVLAELAQQGYKPAEILDYPNIGFVRVFRN